MMLVTLPFFSGDKDQAIRLAQWILDLGGVKNHNCLLVIDESTTAEGVYEPLTEAFRSVSVTSSKPTGAQGTWGNGTTDATAANEMWLTAATYVYHKLKVPFFWMEPDAAPTRSTWLDEIEAEYKSAKKHFMGMRVDMPPHEIHMSGIGCYPYDVANHSLAMMMPGRTAWDYAGRKDTVEKGKAHFTKLIQHVYRINGSVPEWPTFPTLDSLSQIAPETAVFHRCKDGTLIDRLRERNTGVRGLKVKVLPNMEVSNALANPSGPTSNESILRNDYIRMTATEVAKSYADNFRDLCSSAVFLIEGKPGRRAQFQAALRKAGLIGSPKQRMKRKPKLTGVV